MGDNPFRFTDALFKHQKFPASELEKDYNPFLINRSLSYSGDTLFYAQEMNTWNRLPVHMQYDYLNNSITATRGNRNPWAKPDKSDNVLLVSAYYGYSLPKAREALTQLTEADLEIMRKKMEKGGTEGGKR